MDRSEQDADIKRRMLLMFMCCWMHDAAWFVSARTKEDAIVILDESSDAEGAEIRQVRNFTVDFQLNAPDVMAENGHNTYLPGNRCVLNDTHPNNDQKQHPILIRHRHSLSSRHFRSPEQYTGKWRCDTYQRDRG